MHGILHHSILPDPGLPSADSTVIYNGIGGLVRHALRNSIAPSDVLVAIYHYGSNGNYVGYVDSSQIRGQDK